MPATHSNTCRPAVPISCRPLSAPRRNGWFDVLGRPGRHARHQDRRVTNGRCRSVRWLAICLPAGAAATNAGSAPSPLSPDSPGTPSPAPGPEARQRKPAHANGRAPVPWPVCQPACGASARARIRVLICWGSPGHASTTRARSGQGFRCTHVAHSACVEASSQRAGLCGSCRCPTCSVPRNALGCKGFAVAVSATCAVGEGGVIGFDSRRLHHLRKSATP